MATKILRPWNSAINNVSSMHIPRFILQPAEALSFLFFPNHCLHCKAEMYHGERHICARCRRLLHYTDHPHIHRNELHRLFDGRFPLTAAAALWYFDNEGPTRSLLHALKYGGGLSAGWPFGAELGRRIVNHEFKAEALCPVPLHPKRQRKRGFNQAEVIARGISHTTGIPVWDGLKRVRKTESQTKRDAWSRRQNVENVFALRWPNKPVPSSLWMVDDVITTGSTLESACITIAPQAQIGILALAWAQKA